jgi:hypothetical protein
LKTYFDKQHVVRSPAGGQEGKKLVGQKEEMLTGKVLLGSQGIQKRESYVEVLMGKKTNEGSKIPTMVMEGRSSAVAGELTIGNQNADEGETRLILESAKDKVPLFAPGDRAIPNTDAISSRLGRKYPAIKGDFNIFKEGDRQLYA